MYTTIEEHTIFGCEICPIKEKKKKCLWDKRTSTRKVRGNFNIALSFNMNIHVKLNMSKCGTLLIYSSLGKNKFSNQLYHGYVMGQLHQEKLNRIKIHDKIFRIGSWSEGFLFEQRKRFRASSKWSMK